MRFIKPTVEALQMPTLNVQNQALELKLSKILRGFTATPNGFWPVHHQDHGLPLMFEMIALAQAEILVEMYWLAADETGRNFAERLCERARAGVKVFVIYDAVGSWSTPGDFFETMREAGCQVATFRPLRRWFSKVNRFNHRNHRKMIVIDGKALMTGSMNIGDEWMPGTRSEADWRDDGLWVVGPLADKARKLFFHSWRRLTLGLQVQMKIRFPRRTAASLKALTFPISRNEAIVLYGHYPRRNAIRKFYLQMLATAKREVCISNGYFIPDMGLRAALYDAARRGVRVRVLVPAQSDVPAAQFASEKLYEILLKKGVKVYRYGAGILHAKSASADDTWCTIGSYNLDYRSWLFNLEMNVAANVPPLAKAYREQFETDLKQATPVILESWQKRHWRQKFLENFFFLFRRLL